MICQSCGFEQARGNHCQQCGTHLKGENSGSEGLPGYTPSHTSKISPVKEKHRSRPLHDLDLTISMPESPGDPSQSKKASPQKQAAPSVEQLPSDRPVQSESKQEHSAVHESKSKEPSGEVEPAPLKSSPRTQVLPVICTTTSEIQGYRIVSYHGIVSSAAFIKADALDQYSGNIKDVGTLKGSPLEPQMERAHAAVLEDLKQKTSKRGGNALIGVSSNPILEMNGLWVFYSGTAVSVRKG